MKVLFATDGFPAADRARRLFTRLFRNDGTQVHVVSVTHEWSLLPRHIVLELDPIEARREDSRKIADFAATQFTGSGFEATTEVHEGHPGEEIVKATEGFDLVVVGAGGHSWLGNRLLGSVSTFVLHDSPCSVLIVHEADDEDEGGIGRVVVGVDGSDPSTETVRFVSEALEPQRCEIDVVSVAPHTVLGPSPVAVPDEELAARMGDELIAQAEDAAETASVRLREAGFKTESKVLRGGPAAGLLQESLDRRADLIAVGARGLGPVRRAVLGSVSEQVARHAPAAFIGRF